MNWLEVALLVFGVGAFAGSFLIREKTKEHEDCLLYTSDAADEL